MRDLTHFTARLNALFGAGHVARYDAVMCRYAIDSPTAAGGTATQYWQHYYHPTVLDPATGQPLKLEPDPLTGILPFRDLDAGAEEEIIRNMQASFIGSPTEGRGSWRAQFASRQAKNAAVSQAQVKQRAVDFADMVAEMYIGRPWLKHHTGSDLSRRVAMLHES